MRQRGRTRNEPGFRGGAVHGTVGRGKCVAVPGTDCVVRVARTPVKDKYATTWGPHVTGGDVHSETVHGTGSEGTGGATARGRVAHGVKEQAHRGAEHGTYGGVLGGAVWEPGGDRKEREMCRNGTVRGTSRDCEARL